MLAESMLAKVALTVGARRARGRRWAAALAAVVALGLAVVVVPSHRPPSVGAATTGTVMPLQDFANTGANGRLWNATNQTQAASGPTVSGRPSPVLLGQSIQAFVRGDTGDLIQFVADDLNGRTWNAYDITEAAQGPHLAGDPAAVVVGGSTVYIFGRSSDGDLVEFTNDGANGQLWNSTDLTSAAQGPAIEGDPEPLVVGQTLEVFAQGPGGDLVAFSGTGSGARRWSERDLTQASGGPSLSGSPSPILYGAASVHVYGVSTAGDLTEFVNDRAGGTGWSSYDLSTVAAGPTAAGQPTAIVYGPTVHVYVDASGHLNEFVNDGFAGRLWNAYDLTAISQGPVMTGDPSAAFYNKVVVDIFAQGPGGDLVSYVNDGAGGRLWNAYDLTQASNGPSIGTDPAVLVNSGAVSVFAAGPLPPAAVQAIVATAVSQDQDNQGVVETPPGSNCNPYTAYFGRGSTSGCAPGTSAEEWCADFAEWVWTTAGIDTTGIDGLAYSFVSWGEARTGAWFPGATNDPEPGDAVVWGDAATESAVHVGIVVGVQDGSIDVVSGNAGPSIDAAGDVDAVWDSGYFDPATSTVDGEPIIGYVSPVGWTSVAPAGQEKVASAGASLSELISRQDGGK